MLVSKNDEEHRRNQHSGDRTGVISRILDTFLSDLPQPQEV
jgi:hypothetical protein